MNIQAGKGPSSEFEPDIDISLKATTGEFQLLSGRKTRVYTFESGLIKGKPSHLKQLEDNYLGPVIKTKVGQKIRIRLENYLSRETIVHWHGLHVPPEMDGHPMYAIKNGESFVYEFEVVDRPGTYWFHPHPDQITGPQVYHGLAGLFIVTDDKEKSLDLPADDYDMPIIIQDRLFDNENQLVYLEDSPMTQMHGFLGDEILVNGKLNNEIKIKNGQYRLRLLNGSNSRIYKIYLDEDVPLKVIGTDGGLLEKPAELPYLMLAPGERYDVFMDFSVYQEGETIQVKSLAFLGGESIGGMGGMMGRRQSPVQGIPGNGESFDIFKFKITGKTKKEYKLPGELMVVKKLSPSEAVNVNNPRKFNFHMAHMQWMINGKTFEMKEVAPFEKVKLGTTEIWEFINGMQRTMMGQRMMQMPHPVHIHGLQFQIIERDMSAMDPDIVETIKDGFLNEGWQDTFLLMPDMKVKVILRFKDYKGLYIYHCHNLEHEDMGMMRNYEVE